MWPEADRARAPVYDAPPRWASAWGDDRYGLWADLVVGGVTQRMRWIEPDSFWMGSTPAEIAKIADKQTRDLASDEAPQHQVTFRAGFWLADTPCTQALWLVVMGGKNPSHFADGPDAPQRPVEQVSWDGADSFVKALRAAVPQASAMLPTEAQWEYACRAGTRTAYFWGDEPDTQRANMGDAANQTSPVKTYAPNPWGLYDMHGNVWEWCADAKRPYLDRPEVDPSGGDKGDTRVLRGGSWWYLAVGARSAYRFLVPRGHAWHCTGFRLALRSTSPDQRGGAGGR